MKGLGIALMILIVFVSFSSVSALSEYQINGFSSSVFSENQDLGLSFPIDSTCTVSMELTNTFIASVPFDSIASYQSPFGNVFATSEILEGITNTSCVTYGLSGFVSRSVASSGFYEAGNTYTQTATGGFVTTETRYSCQPTANPWTNFTIQVTDDSNSRCLMENLIEDGKTAAARVTELETNYNRCGDLTAWGDNDDGSCQYIDEFKAQDQTVQFIYPFNSSSGLVMLGIGQSETIITHGAGGFQFSVDLIDTNGQTTTSLIADSQAFGPPATDTFDNSGLVTTLPLKADVVYLLVFSYETDGVLGADGFDNATAPEWNISIFSHRADFECPEFGACVNGTKSRSCVDPEGFAPDSLETSTCFDVPSFANLLGFEETSGGVSPGSVHVCNRGWDIFNCPLILDNITAEFPANWTVLPSPDLFTGIFRQNYIRITQDTATEGSKSLQMWYIPPKDEEPVNNGSGGTVCGNKTEGDFPIALTGFNETTFIASNVSFPAPFVQIRMDVRKCSEPVVQRDNSNLTWAPFCDGLFPGSFNRKRCYARDCETEPKGRYGVTLLDAATLEELLDYRSSAVNQWQTKIIDLSNVGIVAGRNYTVVISVNPENVYDPDTHCLYFDNVLATITETALPECISQCSEDLSLNLAILVGNACVFSQEPLSPQCGTTQEIAEALQDLADGTINFTCIGTTQVFFDENGLSDQVADSDLCIDVVEDISGAINATSPVGSAQEGIEIFLFLISPLFIYFYLMIIIGIIATASTKHWEIGGVAMIIMLFIGSLPTIELIPLWISITVMFIIGLLLANELRRATTG